MSTKTQIEKNGEEKLLALPCTGGKAFEEAADDLDSIKRKGTLWDDKYITHDEYTIIRLQQYESQGRNLVISVLKSN